MEIGQRLGQVANAGTHVGDKHRRIDAEAVEREGRLRVNLPGAPGNIVGLVDLVEQPGIADGGRDGVHVGVAVADDEDAFRNRHVYRTSIVKSCKSIVQCPAQMANVSVRHEAAAKRKLFTCHFSVWLPLMIKDFEA